MGVERRPLGDLCHIATGGTPARSESSYFGGEIPWVKISDMLQGVVTTTEETISRAGLENSTAKVFPKGTVLISVFATIGRTALLGIDAATNQAIAGVTPKNDRELDSVYLKRFLDASRRKLEGMARGVAQPNINIGILRALKIPLPPLAEQRRIAAILDKADALRTKRREALDQLDRLAQSIFVEMFGDPVTNPKGWPKVSVGQLLERAEVFVDGDWVESKDQDPNGEVRLIQLADIGDGFYINKSARFLTKQTALRLKCTTLKVGDVLIARMPDPLGRACIFPGDEKECVTVVDVCIVRPSADGPNAQWLMCCLNTQSFRSQIASEATGTTRARISRGNLSKLSIIAPPLELQESFATRYAAVVRQRRQLELAVDKVTQLFDALQDRAFRGEL